MFIKKLHPISLLLVLSLSACALNMNGDINLNSNSTPTSTATADQVATPTITPTSGVVLTGAELTMATETAEAAIYYTMDGTTPDDTSLVYDASAKPQVIEAGTVQAIAYKDGMTPSVVATEIYALMGTVAELTITPASGSYIRGQALEIASATEGVSIYYTLDGTAPTAASTLFNPLAPPTITIDVTVKAIAFKTDMVGSEIVTEEYTVREAGGTLDTTFGVGSTTYGGTRYSDTPDGKIVTWIYWSDDIMGDVKVQADGKIVVAATHLQGAYYMDALRYNTNGELDTSFGAGFNYNSGGVRTIAAGAGRGVALMADGSTIVAGYTGNYNPANTTAGVNVMVAKLDANGALDATFGTGGIVTTAVGAGADVAYSVAVQTDNKVVVAGFYYTGTYKNIVVIRYNTNGTLDNTFGTGGIVKTTTGTGNCMARAIAIQSDGKILIDGFAMNGAATDFVLIRYTDVGALDATFGTAGVAKIAGYGNSWHEANAMHLQGDGKIVAAVYPTQIGYAVARFNTNGSLDTDFGTAGIAKSYVASSADGVFGIDINPADGKIVAAGYTTASGTYDFGAIRYNSDGTVDTSFGTNGKVTIPFGSSTTELVDAVAISGDKIIFAGYIVDGNMDFALVRVWY